jgi:methyl-accepting chemotaxis protein
MSITLNPSSIVSFPSEAIYPTGSTQVVQLTPTQRSIFTSIVEDGQSSLFQNPVSEAISGLSFSVTSLVSTIDNNSCTNYNPSQMTNLRNSLVGTGGLSEEISSFTTHVETLAGVIAGSTNNLTPGLERILSVGRSLNDLVNTVDGISGCLNLLGNMSGLFANDQLNDFSGELENMISQINSCLADIEEMIIRVNEIRDQIQSIINSDRNFFNDSLERLRQAALASLLEYMYNDPCGRYILESKIGQSKLLSKFT